MVNSDVYFLSGEGVVDSGLRSVYAYGRLTPTTGLARQDSKNAARGYPGSTLSTSRFKLVQDVSIFDRQ